MSATIRWARHPGGLWHAFRPDERSGLSACGYTRAKRCGEPAEAVPAGEFPCRACHYRIFGNWKAPKRPRRTVEREVVSDVQLFEAVGGRLDGARFHARIIMRSETEWQLIGGTYASSRPPLRSREVEKNPVAGEEQP